MVINFDKNIDPNITKILVAGDNEYEMVNVVTSGSMGWTVDRDTFTLTFLGTTDVQIIFNNLDNLQIYSHQIEFATSTPYNPYASGINTDPHYDNPKSGGIQSHSYVDTDIEQDLINGDS